MSTRSDDTQHSRPVAAGLRRGAGIDWEDLPLLMTQREAADVLHCSLSHFRSMIAAGRVNQVRISRRVVRISRLALQELVERGGPATGA